MLICSNFKRSECRFPPDLKEDHVIYLNCFDNYAYNYNHIHANSYIDILLNILFIDYDKEI